MSRWVIAGSLLLQSGCVGFSVLEGESLSDAPAYEPADEEVAPGAGGPASPEAFVGVELEEALAGSLESLQFLGGLRVASVAAGSPAESAAIRAGDRVVRAALRGASVELARVDQWSALLAGAKPGDELRLSIERDGGLVDLAVRAAARGAGSRPPARRFVERRKLRCVVETELVAQDGRTRSAARLVELAESSPLRAAGLAPGVLLLALDGVELAGAADLARRVAALPWGREVTLDLLDGGARRAVDVELWEPERRLTALEVWPLFAWSESADESRAGLEVLDLWLIWLLKHERKGATSKTSILRFIEWESGSGALTEEPAAGAGR